MKVYPGQRAGGLEADLMATNELSAHAYLQVRYIDLLYHRVFKVLAFLSNFPLTCNTVRAKVEV